jgi:hypothetical protein
MVNVMEGARKNERNGRRNNEGGEMEAGRQMEGRSETNARRKREVNEER